MSSNVRIIRGSLMKKTTQKVMAPPAPAVAPPALKDSSLTVEGRVALLTLQRNDVRNALTGTALPLVYFLNLRFPSDPPPESNADVSEPDPSAPVASKRRLTTY